MNSRYGGHRVNVMGTNFRGSRNLKLSYFLASFTRYILGERGTGTENGEADSLTRLQEGT